MQLTNYNLESQTTGYNYFTPKAVLYNTHRRHVNEMRIIKLSRWTINKNPRYSLRALPRRS